MSWHGGHLRACRALLVAPLLTVCTQGSSDLTPNELQTVEKWLNCEECLDGEREAVRAVGQRGVPTLERALKKGPPSEYRDNMRSKFNDLYTTIHAAMSPPNTTAVSRAAYVDRALSNYVARYQKRAVLSLSDIGGAQATSALQAATTQGGYRPDVLDAIRVAQMLADTVNRFRGGITPGTPAFGDTVTLRPPAYQPFNGDESAHIEGSPVAPNDTRIFADSNGLRFLAVGFPGQRVLTVRNVGTTADSQHATIVLRTLTDANDRRMSACADLRCRLDRAPRYVAVPNSFSTFLTLWRTASSVDTVDLLRFQPSTPLHITAQLSWSDSTTNLDLRWVNCQMTVAGNLTPAGNTNGATGDHPERTTVDIPGGRCWVLLVLLSSPAPVRPVIAHLRVSP